MIFLRFEEGQLLSCPHLDPLSPIMRRIVKVSSARQAVFGRLTVGGVKAAGYLTNKIQNAWRSWT